jgi:hypothetical protein
MTAVRQGTFAILLLSGACSVAERKVPDEATVIRLERALAGTACVGSLAQWERHYLYPMKGVSGDPDFRLDEQTIAFDFLQAGVSGNKAGRIRETLADMGLDHGQYRYVSGRYDIPSARVTIDSCGLNCPANVPIGGSCG